MAIIDSYLAYLVEVGGTDLLLAAGARPLMRINGQLQVMKRRLVAATDVEYHAQEVLGAERMSRLPELKSVDFVYEASLNGSERRFRGSVYYQRNGLNIILRAVPAHPVTIADLGFDSAIEALADTRSGLVLVVEPARSGKTALLSAMVEALNSQPVHVITLEDPIEHIHQPREALISQRQIGLHAESFASALDGALREDPDAVVVSEVRDGATARRLLRVAEMGSLVLAGMECSSSLRGLERILDFFEPGERDGTRRLLSRVVKGVVALQTVPRADGTGRAVAAEVLVSGPAMAAAIREARTLAMIDLMRAGTRGMRLMEEDLSTLARTGVISADEASARMEACEMARVGGN